MATKYRRHFGRNQDWHFHPDCLDWPEANYLEKPQLDEHEEICEKCIELRDESSKSNE